MDETLEALRERLLEVNQQSAVIVATADAEKRELTDEEREQVDGLLLEFDQIEADIGRRDKLNKQRTALSEPQPRKTEPEQIRDRPEPAEPNEPEPAPRRTEGRQPISATPRTPDNRWGWRSFGEFAHAVCRASRHGGIVDRRLEVRAPTTFGAETPGSDGGFAVPPDFRNEIISHIGGEASLMSRCDQLISSGNNISVPTDEDTPWSTSGITAYWEGENDLISQSKPVLQQNNIRLNKLAVLVPVTDELLEDAPAMGTYLRRKAPEKMDFKINLAIVQGNGVGQPLGILSSGCLVSVAKETSQPADTILAENIMKMWSRMYAPSRANAVWLINQDVEPQLFNMYLPVKNVAGSENVGGAPAYMPANGLSGSPYSTLMGRPVVPTQACETVGDKGDIIFADLKQYMIAMKAGGVRAETSIHLWFDYDTTAFRFILRVAGQPWWSAAADPRDGSNTLSPFVTLDARA